MGAMWFVPRKTYEIALENNKKINEQRIKVSEENKELQIKVITLEKQLDDAKNKIKELKKKVKSLETCTTTIIDEKGITILPKKAPRKPRTPKKEAE